jgi:ABC-type uncharacterized transport system involved in gliding motility auxiliary subunit
LQIGNFAENEIMEALKFVTKVRKHGIIKIPALESYANKKVDVIVTLKPEEQDNTAQKKIDDFLEKWGGFFSEVDTDDGKYNYLMEKYK